MILVWRVVDSCNLACPFCAFDKRLAYPRRHAAVERVERFLDLLGAWADSGEPVMLSWLGGEPLLWGPLEALTERAHRLGLAVSTTTNGTTLGSSRVRRHLLDRYSEVTVSIDGFADFHDAMRGWPGAFAKLQRHVAELAGERDAAGAPLRIRANVVLMRGNIDRFADLCGELAGWGVDEISFNQLGGRDRPEFFPAQRLRPADVAALRALLPELRARLGGTRIVGSASYLDRIDGSTRGIPLPIRDCRVAEDFLFIDEEGRIAPCSFTPDHFAVSVNDVRSIDQLAGLPAWFRARQRRCPAASCADCPSTQQFAKFEAVAA